MKFKEDRFIFLRAFTKELILNSKPSKFPSPFETEETESLELEIEKPVETETLTPSMPITEQKTPFFIPEAPPRFLPEKRFTLPISSAPTPLFTAQPTLTISLGKLDMFLRDPQVTVIECTGQGKFLIVKKLNQIQATRISLSKDEIDNIINKFSEEARIPIIGGIFKAAVGNLKISAVLSDVAGNRFIISKSSPYSMLER